MGTRSTYRFIEKGVYEGKPREDNFVLVYMQYDGYPDGHPLDTAKWLARGKMVNGIGMQDTGLLFNGVGCLAAQFIARYKNGAGGTYIYPMSHRCKAGENYVYDIVVDETQKITMVAYENHTGYDNGPVKVKKLFEGSPEEFISKFEKKVEVEE